MQYQVAAVFTSLTLPDGDFRQILDVSSERANPVPVVVCLAELDGGWSDLLEAGVFAVLEDRCDARQVRKIVDAVVGAAVRTVASVCP
jgi:hypothetical protein